jgi:hypothetical protein
MERPVRPPDPERKRLTPHQVSLEARIRELVGPRTFRAAPDPGSEDPRVTRLLNFFSDYLTAMGPEERAEVAEAFYSAYPESEPLARRLLEELRAGLRRGSTAPDA